MPSAQPLAILPTLLAVLPPGRAAAPCLAAFDATKLCPRDPLQRDKRQSQAANDE